MSQAWMQSSVRRQAKPMSKHKVTQGKKGTNSELPNQKSRQEKSTPTQSNIETKDEDIVLGEQSVIVSKKFKKKKKKI